ncbi:hypothetical protein MUDCAT_61 [Arthrobacter phage Mudcat]|uniref:Lipoprotein n=5 Tax=Mudcatvirus TaxID=1982088 RepID=A0A222Z696_9CAUD|nr:site-specific recombination directionality factor RDF [Arthrobacter phage Mudcat]YP_010666053.1 site-specific recombination directionality factor RDF [Arthrobacter phage Arcadia]YP_010666445.1 site-specific recombination directionality factor RDF [Arthrobacter phage Xenomorph]YP_010666542.1 site-specific recombination directionality factor RDF [Arthrobacter phage Heisenberger]YP_010666642.1 site-specific recombination directionality factor RDF [Arthrobacter phage JEGGS]ASR80221.1 hypothetic
MKKLWLGVAAIALVIGTTAAGCEGPSQSEVASKNSSTAADNFEVQRKIVGLNTKNMQYVFFVEGRCSIERSEGDLITMCKHGENDFRKHYLGLPAGATDVIWTATQQESIDVSVYKTRVILKPEGLIPEIELSMGVQ